MGDFVLALNYPQDKAKTDYKLEVTATFRGESRHDNHYFTYFRSGWYILYMFYSHLFYFYISNKFLFITHNIFMGH